jgi:hypothetical protein
VIIVSFFFLEFSWALVFKKNAEKEKMSSVLHSGASQAHGPRSEGGEEMPMF